MEFKELTIEELSAGFIRTEGCTEYVCIFCGETFEDGVIYQSRGRMVTAEKAAREHVFDEHGSVFSGLISLDKQISGLSDVQKEILTGLYLEKDNKDLGRELNISEGTVRTHKFKLQKMKREAKILLALLAQIEDEEVVSVNRLLQQGSSEQTSSAPDFTKEFSGNSLHPFFTQFNLK